MAVTCPRCSRTFRRGFGSHVWACDISPEEVFWAWVDKSGGPDACWVFRGCRDKWGYAHTGIGHKRIQAHRHAYVLKVGPIPAGKLVMHTCDNPPCVNPAHLLLGTDADNALDKVSKLRHAHGERNSHAKLTEAEVLAIRAEYRYENRRSNARELCAKYGVSDATITGITSRRIWRHI